MNREYRRVLSTDPCGAPGLRISEVEVLFPPFTTWGRPVRKSRTQLHRVGFREGLELNNELRGFYGVEC